MMYDVTYTMRGVDGLVHRTYGFEAESGDEAASLASRRVPEGIAGSFWITAIVPAAAAAVPSPPGRNAKSRRSLKNG
ncbi:MAG TPA: hypothetical protein VHL08_04630 [Dongiaceae bacterium]|jgi:hypothetical protein|nr:hypothetical protein [Dongiaceae bacterium]